LGGWGSPAAWTGLFVQVDTPIDHQIHPSPVLRQRHEQVMTVAGGSRYVADTVTDTAAAGLPHLLQANMCEHSWRLELVIN